METRRPGVFHLSPGPGRAGSSQVRRPQSWCRAEDAGGAESAPGADRTKPPADHRASTGRAFYRALIRLLGGPRARPGANGAPPQTADSATIVARPRPAPLRMSSGLRTAGAVSQDRTVPGSVRSRPVCVGPTVPGATLAGCLPGWVGLRSVMGRFRRQSSRGRPRPSVGQCVLGPTLLSSQQTRHTRSDRPAAVFSPARSVDRPHPAAQPAESKRSVELSQIGPGGPDPVHRGVLRAITLD